MGLMDNDMDMQSVENRFKGHVPKRHVIVVNGKPRVGKDTAIEMMTNRLKELNFFVDSFSSIDPIRTMLMTFGIDVSAKTPADRDLLAEVGISVEKHSQWRSNKCVAEISNMMGMSARDSVMFLHVREMEVIERIMKQIEARGWNFHTVAVLSKRGENITSNAADAGVFEYVYDQYLDNEGNLGDLKTACEKLLVKMGIIPA